MNNSVCKAHYFRHVFTRVCLGFRGFFQLSILKNKPNAKITQNHMLWCMLGHMDQLEHCRQAVPCPWVHEAFLGGTWSSQRCGKFHICSFILCSSMLWSWDRIFRTCIVCKILLELYWSSLSCLHKSMRSLDFSNYTIYQ